MNANAPSKEMGRSLEARVASASDLILPSGVHRQCDAHRIVTNAGPATRNR
jgi:hypothetical protein